MKKILIVDDMEQNLELLEARLIIMKLEKKLLDLEKEVASREKTEEALRESEERFRLAFRTSPDSININRLENGMYVDINEGFTAITGYTREEIIGKTSLEINIWVNPKDREKLVAGLKERGSVNNLEAKFRFKDGRVVTGLMSATTLKLNGVPHILSVTRDIEEIKQAKDALQRKAEELAVLNVVSQEVSASLSLNQVVRVALDGVVAAAHPDLALLFLREGDRLFLKLAAPENSKFTHEETPVHRVGECLCGQVANHKKPIFSLNIHNDPRCTWDECKKAGLHSFAALPLRSGDEIIGVLGLGSGTERDFEEETSFLETLSSQISIGLQNALLHEELERHAGDLEERVAERTSELEKKTRDLEKFNRLFVDRELRMVALKERIGVLERKLAAKRG